MITTIKLISTHLCMRVCVQVNTLGLLAANFKYNTNFKQPYSPCCTLGFQNIFILQPKDGPLDQNPPITQLLVTSHTYSLLLSVTIFRFIEVDHVLVFLRLA